MQRVFLELYASLGSALLHFSSPQLGTSLHCETTDNTFEITRKAEIFHVKLRPRDVILSFAGTAYSMSNQAECCVIPDVCSSCKVALLSLVLRTG